MDTIKFNFNPGQSQSWKLLRSVGAVVDGHIRPEHIRLYPTNRCNAACTFCRIREWMGEGEEIPTPELLDLVRHFHVLGTRAITVAGGGEPTLHPGFDALLDLCRELDIHVGVITNGLLWSDKIKEVPANGKLIWARMSVIDSESGKYDVERLRRFSENLSRVDVGCYATVTRNTDAAFIERLAELAETLPNVTHFKLGEDSLLGAPKKMEELEKRLSGKYSKTIFQKYSDAPPGVKNCLVSLLRPVVGADGYVYPCCSMGLETGNILETRKFRMAYWRDFGPDIPCFDGSGCIQCIWSQYNQALEGLTRPLEHGQFI